MDVRPMIYPRDKRKVGRMADDVMLAAEEELEKREEIVAQGKSEKAAQPEKVQAKKKTKPSSRSRKKSKGNPADGNGHNKELGRRGEEAAAQYLYHRGYTIEERNWTCAAGEADIIARDENALVFVEVKTRTGAEKGHPEEAVDARKRARYEKIAALYLADHEVVDVQVRFDVVSILVVSEDRAFIRHHINAFGVGY